MIYHKFELNDRQIVINELYDDELVAYCGSCQIEIPITLRDIKEIHEAGADFSGTNFYCRDCSTKKSWSERS